MKEKITVPYHQNMSPFHKIKMQKNKKYRKLSIIRNWYYAQVPKRYLRLLLDLRIIAYKGYKNRNMFFQLKCNFIFVISSSYILYSFYWYIWQNMLKGGTFLCNHMCSHDKLVIKTLQKYGMFCWNTFFKHWLHKELQKI